MRWALTAVLLAGAVSSPAGAQQSWSPPSLLERKTTWVFRHDVQGKILWSTLLDGDIRDVDFLSDEKRVYVNRADGVGGVTALHMDDGTIVWQTKGRIEHLLLSDGLLLSTTRTWKEGEDAMSCWLAACDGAQGTEVFKILLPREFTQPQTVQEVAGLFLVQKGGGPDGKGFALLFDRKGKVRHRLNRHVIAGKRCEEDALFLTCSDVARVAANDKLVWSISFGDHEWTAGGGLVDLPGGDLLAFRFGRISDSGVDLIRFDSMSGKAVWKVHCAPLGVDHSKYRHDAFVAVEGEKLRVTSKGSFGTFVEILDMKTGRQLERTSKSGDS